MTRFQWLPTDSPFSERPFRRVFERVKRPLPPDPEIVTAYTDGQVTLRSNRDKEGYHEAADLSGFQGVEVGDFVVHGLDILRGSVGVADSAGALSSICTVCVPRGKAEPRFFAYAMRAQAWSGVPRVLARGVREGGADFRRWDTLAELPLPVPNFSEQRLIADYLDRETEHIGALISKKRRLIELLNKYRHAIIVAAFSGRVVVADGLHVQMHSRAQDLDPQHEQLRETRPLRAYAEVDLGRQRSPRHDTGPHMTPYLRAANVKDGELDLSDVKSMNFEPNERDQFSLQRGDVLVTEGAGSLAAVGVSAVWNGEIEETICFQNTLLRLRPKGSTDSRFLAWWCRFAHAGGLFASVAQGANIYHISAERVRSLPMAYAPLVVQQAIADYLDAETSRIDAIIKKENQTVNLLVERWQSLITAAVTGEISVQKVQR